MATEQEIISSSNPQDTIIEFSKERQFSIVKSEDSSELSDLGEDQSEAETDKMDFLRPENSSTDNVLDLNTLSKLTELARLEGIDSDDDLEVDENGINNEIKRSKRRLDDDRRVKRIKGEEDVEKGIKEQEEARGEVEADQEDVREEEQETEERKVDQVEEGGAQEDKVGVQAKDATVIEDATAAEEDEEADQEDEQDDEDKDEGNGPDEEQELDHDDNQLDDEDDVDLNEQRQLAVQELRSIEKAFVEIRDKLYQDKLKTLEHELQLCLDGSHPELTKVYYKINEFYQDSLRLANNTLNYRLKCINTETIATRTSIHQVFLKEIMDGKNDLILETTSKWYKINKERTQMDQIIPDYYYPAIPPTSPIIPISDELQANGYHESSLMPDKKTIKQNNIIDLVQQRNNLNQQLGILNGLLQFHGIPSAVNLSSDVANHQLLLAKASEDEIAEDFTAMGIPI